MSAPQTPVFAAKFCGITIREDALAAIFAGAAALGFNGWPRSKRYLDLAAAASWIRDLPTYVVRVAVLVNPTLEEVRAIHALGCFELLQLHGDESPEFCQTLQDTGIRIVKALPLEEESDLARIAEYSTPHILLDAKAPGEYGGTGRAIDWSLARRAVLEFPGKNIILSGGLKPGNVREAARKVQPYALDVASGIESAPGIKDADAMREFILQLSADGA